MARFKFNLADILLGTADIPQTFGSTLAEHLHLLRHFSLLYPFKRRYEEFIEIVSDVLGLSEQEV